MTSIRCYGMYGVVGGPFPYGFYYSKGLDVLADKLRRIGSHVHVLPTFGWSEWRRIVTDIGRQSHKTKIVIYGHSLGANQATVIARKLKNRPIDLIAAFDPTIWYPTKSLGANVQRAIWFRGVSPFSPVGHGTLRAGTKFVGELIKIDSPDRHEKIDDNPKFHEIVVETVRSLS